MHTNRKEYNPIQLHTGEVAQYGTPQLNSWPASFYVSIEKNNCTQPKRIMALENAIYNKAAECLKNFNDCIESMVSTPWPQDQLDRFNLWAAHGGIFGSYEKRTSMDWRLRERPELVDMILQLLTLLHEYLSGNAQFLADDLMLP